jgi:hypothetical protein
LWFSDFYFVPLTMATSAEVFQELARTAASAAVRMNYGIARRVCMKFGAMSFFTVGISPREKRPAAQVLSIRHWL